MAGKALQELEAAGHILSLVSKQRLERESCLAHFPLFTASGSPVYEMLLPSLRMGLSSSVNPSGNTPIDTSTGVFPW